MNRIIQMIVIAGLWRGVRWLVDRWSERGGPAQTAEERRSRRGEARKMNRNIGLLRRISRWIR